MNRAWTDSRHREEQATIRQRIGLALLHMVVLASIWAVLASFVYSMEQSYTMHTVDQQLYQLSRGVSIGKEIVVKHDNTDQTTDVHILVWSPGNKIIQYYHTFPDPSLPMIRRALLIHRQARPVYYSLTVVGIPYRVRQWSIASHRQVQLFDGVQDDQSRLARLLTLFIWGGAMGLVLSLVGGFLMGLWTLQPVFRARRREQAFLSDVSHELRTPLSAMSAHVELLIQNADDPIAAHLPWIETLYSEVERMTRMVNDLLEAGRLEEGPGALTLTRVSLRELCETVDAIYRPVLEESGLCLTLNISEDAVILADASRLRQLLLIFLDNAHKHTREGGVTLTVVVHGAHAELHVQDTGDGMLMAPGTWKTKSAVGDGSQTSLSTGLGLVIARKIIAAHNATLSIHSEPGIGTDVIVTFRTIPSPRT